MPAYDDILVALRRITRAIDIQSKRLAKVSGLTAPQLLVMQAIRKQGQAKPSSIAQDVLLSQATVTTIIDRLETSELVSRERSTADRRVVFISLTETGRERLLKAPELLQAGFIRELDKLEDWERSLIVASLQRVAAMMDADDIEAAPILEVGDLTSE
ncbi:MAG: MarR family transcriptional regulator [Pseudomonadota bacterium]